MYRTGVLFSSHLKARPKVFEIKRKLKRKGNEGGRTCGGGAKRSPSRRSLLPLRFRFRVRVINNLRYVRVHMRTYACMHIHTCIFMWTYGFPGEPLYCQLIYGLPLHFLWISCKVHMTPLCQTDIVFSRKAPLACTARNVYLFSYAYTLREQASRPHRA